MSTKTALWIVGGAVAALAIYYAFGAHATVASNDAGLTSASPPPQPVGGTLLTTRPILTGGGAFSTLGGRQFFR